MRGSKKQALLETTSRRSQTQARLPSHPPAAPRSCPQETPSPSLAPPPTCPLQTALRSQCSAQPALLARSPTHCPTARPRPCRPGVAEGCHPSPLRPRHSAVDPDQPSLQSRWTLKRRACRAATQPRQLSPGLLHRRTPPQSRKSPWSATPVGRWWTCGAVPVVLGSGSWTCSAVRAVLDSGSWTCGAGRAGGRCQRSRSSLPELQMPGDSV
jgi:hypothetical protein